MPPRPTLAADDQPAAYDDAMFEDDAFDDDAAAGAAAAADVAAASGADIELEADPADVPNPRRRGDAAPPPHCSRG